MASNSVIHVHSIHDGVIAWFLKRNLLINQLLCLLDIPDRDKLKCTITSMIKMFRESDKLHTHLKCSETSHPCRLVLEYNNYCSKHQVHK